MSSYIDEIDRKIFPFVSWQGYDEYPTFDPLYTTDVIPDLRRVSRELFRIMIKVVKHYAMNDSEKLFSYLSIPKKLQPFILEDIELLPYALLSRFDFVLDKGGVFKMVELNADTPCAIVEAFYGNDVAAKHYGFINPNRDEDYHLKSFLTSLIDTWSIYRGLNRVNNISPERPFVFACFDDYIEDKATTEFLMNKLKEAISEGLIKNACPDAIEFCSFYNLRINNDGIVLPDGRNAGAIYRMHPLELLIEEKGEDGSDLGVSFMEAYQNKKFTMLNPVSAGLLQSKGLHALLWEIITWGADFISRKEQLFLLEHIPLSSLSEDLFNDRKHVCKPIWGREGEDIIVSDGSLIQPVGCYMYQKFVESDDVSLRTGMGATTGKMTYSCFMLGQSPSAVYGRFSSNEIAGIEAYWAPLL